MPFSRRCRSAVGDVMIHSSKQMTDNRTTPTVTMVESPYSGNIDRNVRYLLICHFDCAVVHREVPYSSHSYMTQHPRAKRFFVSDDEKKWDVLTRDQAIESSHIIRKRCDRTVFYTDLGWSTGMKAAKEFCQTNGLPFEERRVDVAAIASKVAFLTETFCRAIIDGKAYDQFLE